MSVKIKLGDWAKFYKISTRQVIRWRDDYELAIPSLKEEGGCPLGDPTKMISLWPQVYKREVSAALKETESSGRTPPQGSVKISSGKTSAPAAPASQKFDFSAMPTAERFDFRDAVNSAEKNCSRWKHVIDEAAKVGNMTDFRSAQGAYNDALETLRKTKLAAAKIAESEGTSVSREIIATELRRIHGGIPKSLRTTIFEELLGIVQMGILPTRDQLREIVASAVDAACIRLRDSKFEFENVA